MEIHLSPESEARFAEIAAHRGLDTAELAKEVLSQYVEDQVRFVEAVKVGLAAAERGEFVESHEVWANVERILQS
jgi:predicted transcriptional regulator